MAKKKTISQLKKKLQPIFNRYIRLRDCGDDRGAKCISCGEWFRFEDMDAGHYFARSGYDGLRFNEDNVHAEHSGCNRFDDSHLIGYGINLHKKIGEERYEALLEAAKMYKMHGNKWYRSELEKLIVHYQQELMILEGKYL